MSRGLVKYTLYISIFPFNHIYKETVCVTNNVRGKNSKDTISCLHDIDQIAQDRTPRKHVIDMHFFNHSRAPFLIWNYVPWKLFCATHLMNVCSLTPHHHRSVSCVIKRSYLFKKINLHTMNIKYKVRYSTCHMLCPGMSIIFSPSCWTVMKARGLAP